MTPEVQRELVGLAKLWAEEGKDDLAHHALDVLGREDEDAPSVPCPSCGEVERVEDTSTGPDRRFTCKRCGMSWHPQGGEARG